MFVRTLPAAFVLLGDDIIAPRPFRPPPTTLLAFVRTFDVVLLAFDILPPAFDILPAVALGIAPSTEEAEPAQVNIIPIDKTRVTPKVLVFFTIGYREHTYDLILSIQTEILNLRINWRKWIRTST